LSVGIYLSGCRGDVSSVLDLDALAQTLEGEAEMIRVVDDFFDPATQEQILSDITEGGLGALILAGRSLDHYNRSLSGRLLHERIIGAGINPSKAVFASLLEQVAQPHADDPSAAQIKAEAMMRVALSRAKNVEALPSISMVARQSVLVLGATIEGLVAAQRLLQLGYHVTLADRGEAMALLDETDQLHATVAFVKGHPESEIVSHAHMVDGFGWVGDYEIVLEANGERTTHDVGGILVAEPEDVDWVEEIRRHFRLDVDDEGHARSINPASHPAETVEPGLMVVPVYGEGETELRAKVAAADSAAMALALRLSQPETIHYVQTSSVNENLCGACASCVKTCAFGACYIDEDGVSHVDPRRCRACGKCVVSCPVGARDIISSPHEFMVGAIEMLSKVDIDGPRVLGIVCGGCGNPAMNAAGELGAGAYPASFLPLWIPCSGRLDALYVLEAFKSGFDGITVFRCREGHCHNLIGNLDMDRRINLLRTVLRSRDLDDTRLRIIDISPDEGEHFAASVREFMDELTSIPEDTEEVSA
jgi:heterodisulfide reductase subunit A-like polyferredoxin/coenzyme F420-reducing hydrogenase delta subunit